MAGRYELSRSSDGQFVFNLKAANGRVILASERYTTKAGAMNGIASVRANAPEDGHYHRLTSRARQPYFVLKAGNGETIGCSQMYSAPSAMETGIASVKANGPESRLIDRT